MEARVILEKMDGINALARKRKTSVRPLRQPIPSDTESEHENDDDQNNELEDNYNNNNELDDNPNNNVDLGGTSPNPKITILKPKLNQQLWVNFEKELFTDIKFILKDEKVVKAHKLILVSCGSSVFRKLLGGDRFNSFEEIHLPEINVEGCKAALRYIYMEDKQFKDIISVTNTYFVARIFDMKNLAIKCLQYMKNYKIKFSELFHILHLADLFDIQFLVYKCILFIVENTETVLCSDSFLEQDLDFVLKMCSMQLLNIKSEFHLFNAVVKWVKHQIYSNKSTAGMTVDPNEFRQGMKPFLPHIRFISMSADDFSKIIDQNKELFDKTEQLDMLMSIATKNKNKFPAWCNTNDTLRCTKIKNKKNIKTKDIFLSQEEDICEFLEINLTTKNETRNSESSSSIKKALEPVEENISCHLLIECKSQPFKLHGLALRWKKKQNYIGPVMLTHSISVECGTTIRNKQVVGTRKLIRTPKSCRHNEEDAKITFALPILLERGIYKITASLSLIRGVEFKVIGSNKFSVTPLENLPFEVRSYKKHDNSFFISDVFYERCEWNQVPSGESGSPSSKKARIDDDSDSPK